MRAESQDSPNELLSALYDAHGEKLRYLIVGAFNTAVSYVLFLACLAIVGEPLRALSGVESPAAAFLAEKYYLIAQWVGWVIMVPISTVNMKYFAFRSRGRWLPQVFRAYFVYLPAQGLSSLLLWLAVDVAHLSPKIGQLAAIVVAAVVSYIGHKYFTFRLPLEVGEVPDEELL